MDLVTPPRSTQLLHPPKWPIMTRKGTTHSWQSLSSRSSTTSKLDHSRTSLTPRSLSTRTSTGATSISSPTSSMGEVGACLRRRWRHREPVTSCMLVDGISSNGNSTTHRSKSATIPVVRPQRGSEQPRADRCRRDADAEVARHTGSQGRSGHGGLTLTTCGCRDGPSTPVPAGPTVSEAQRVRQEEWSRRPARAVGPLLRARSAHLGEGHALRLHRQQRRHAVEEGREHEHRLVGIAVDELALLLAVADDLSQHRPPPPIHPIALRRAARIAQCQHAQFHPQRPVVVTQHRLDEDAELVRRSRRLLDANGVSVVELQLHEGPTLRRAALLAVEPVEDRCRARAGNLGDVDHRAFA